MRHSLLIKLLLCMLLLANGIANATSVTFAGMAYSGDSKSIPQRFPYTQRLEKSLAKSGSPINKEINAALAQHKPANFELNQTGLTSLKGQDQAIVVTMLITDETVSVERFGSVAKLLTQVRAQAMFFDFKTMTVLRAYPFSFAHLDVIDHYPNEAEMQSRFSTVFYGADDKPGILSRFADVVAKASIPNNVPRYLQVAQVKFGDEARQVLPAKLAKSPGVAETWLADLFAESLSSKTDVPLLPYSKGYAIGNVMSMRLSDGDVFMLKIPEADYTISLEVPRFKKIVSEQVAAGTSLIYGAYAHIKIQEPVSGKSYMDADFKNGEVKLVPASQDNTDDFPAYYEAIKGLFTKLSDNLTGNKTDWLSSATDTSGIKKQINSTQELLKSCK